MMTKKINDPVVIDITPFLKKRKKEKRSNDYSKLYDVVDVLVQLSILLDSYGHSKYGDMLSDIVEEMFSDSEITPEMWGWESESEDDSL